MRIKKRTKTDKKTEIKSAKTNDGYVWWSSGDGWCDTLKNDGPTNGRHSMKGHSIRFPMLKRTGMQR